MDSCLLQQPRWGDLDVNQHVNNVKYIGWILEVVILVPYIHCLEKNNLALSFYMVVVREPFYVVLAIIF